MNKRIKIMGTKPNKIISELIYNQQFIAWVISPDFEKDLYWEQFILKNPARKKEIDNAIFIIKSLNREEKVLDDESVSKLYEKIHVNIHKNIYIRNRNTNPFILWMAAASIIGAALIFIQLQHGESTSSDNSSVTSMKSDGNEVKLILSDKSEKLFASVDPVIKYNKSGEIEIDSSKIFTKNANTSNPGEEQLNQLVVPYGKRSSLLLSDGTRLWLNSGSSVTYPVDFIKNEREIYLKGEAYFEVAHDDAKPFYVITDYMKVRVLGTEFNVNAYDDDIKTTVVLVKGSVQAEIASRKIQLKENQLMTLKNSSGVTALEEVNVLNYISWKEGWMNCINEKLENVAVKLSKYYNIDIRFKDPKVKEMTLTGKLDLKNSFEEVFRVISYTAPVDYEINDRNILVFLKENK